MTPTWKNVLSGDATPAKLTKTTPNAKPTSKLAPACSAHGWTKVSKTLSAKQKPVMAKKKIKTFATTTVVAAKNKQQKSKSLTNFSNVSKQLRNHAKNGSCNSVSPLPPRSGDIVAQAKQAIARRGDFTFGPLTIELHYGDRVAVTGPNGAGKSTLLNVLLGRIQPIEGTVSAGSRVVIGEIDQARAAFEGEETLGRRFSLEVPDWPDADVRTLLAKFGLKTNHVNRSAFSLSPGERTRAGLALLQARGVNLLVLDEPTNHLDLPAIEQLEEALEAFDGTILLVTHDRRMHESVRLTRRWHVENGTIEEIDAD